MAKLGAIISDYEKYGPKPDYGPLKAKAQPPTWWGGNNYEMLKKYGGGTKHSGPSGRGLGWSGRYSNSKLTKKSRRG